MTTFRLRNMLTDRLYETKSLEAITGELPYSQESAVQETISWLRENGEI
jgi:biotin operon repressor